jgi:ribosomal small subunit protein bTHX
MGKGDRKTAKGKRTIGSYGNTRKRKKAIPVVAAPKKKSAPKKKAAAPEVEDTKKTTAKTTAKKTCSQKTCSQKTRRKKEGRIVSVSVLPRLFFNIIISNEQHETQLWSWTLYTSSNSFQGGCRSSR